MMQGYRARARRVSHSPGAIATKARGIKERYYAASMTTRLGIHRRSTEVGIPLTHVYAERFYEKYQYGKYTHVCFVNLAIESGLRRY